MLLEGEPLSTHSTADGAHDPKASEGAFLVTAGAGRLLALMPAPACPRGVILSQYR